MPDYVSYIAIGNGEERPIKDENALRREELLDLVYPVGSIYMSANSTNPGTIFGGTWVAWGAGRVPVGVGTSDRAFAANETGGASTVKLTAAQSGVPAHAHGLNSHTHGYGSILAKTPALRSDYGDYMHAPYTISLHQGTINGSSSASYSYMRMVASSGGSGSSGTTARNFGRDYIDIAAGKSCTMSGSTAAASGSTANNTAAAASQAHSNLQPYITCYMWKRTA